MVAKRCSSWRLTPPRFGIGQEGSGAQRWLPHPPLPGVPKGRMSDLQDRRWRAVDFSKALKVRFRKCFPTS